MDNATFFNAYVENLLAEITELNKQKLMMKTQLDVLNAVSAQQAEKIRELEESLDKQAQSPPKKKKDEDSF